MKTGISNLTLSLLCVFSFLNLNAQKKEDVIYQRGSIIQMMIEHPMYMFNGELANTFKRLPVSNRFNDHGLGVKVVKFATQEFVDQENYISSFIRQVNLGNRAVAKWFNWNKHTGTFDMELIKERGIYNANALDKELAMLNTRGSAILSDAGEKLIHNTFLVMSDICYTGNYTNKESEMSLTNTTHRFDVKIVSYIYQLNWDDEQLNEFYHRYYNNSTKDFVDIANYGFTFRTKVETEYGEESKQISQSDLIERVVARCLDINMAKLQKAYPDFRIKSLLTSTEPISSDVGLKEGITADSLFEVLEMNIDKKGIVSYKRVGIIKPVADLIWDNRYMAEEEGAAASALGFTTFKKVSGGKFFPGMLIREIEN